MKRREGNCTMELERPVTFGIVGLGRISASHAGEITKTDGLALTAACDILPEAQERFAQTYSGVAMFDNFDDMLAAGGFQVVVISTPSHLHYAMTMAALEKGFHVLVEKPMAGSADEARQMLQAAKKADRFLTVNQSVRYQPDTRWVKEVIDSGKLGRVFKVYRSQHGFGQRKDWQIWRKYNGGIVSNLGTHFVDSAIRMVQSEPQTVFAKFHSIRDLGDAEDCYTIVIRCEDGAIIESEFVKSYFGNSLWHVWGTTGSLYIHDELPLMTMKVQTLDGEQFTREYDFRDDAGNHGPYYEDFSAHLLAGKAPPVTAESVIRQLAVLDAARESDRSGESVKVVL